MYKIHEAHIVYKNGKLHEVAVLWDDNGAVRATFANAQPKAGYIFFNEDDVISPNLLQSIAGSGAYLDEERKEKYFPGDRPWSR